jgi:hypothetical protein
MSLITRQYRVSRHGKEDRLDECTLSRHPMAVTAHGGSWSCPPGAPNGPYP